MKTNDPEYIKQKADISRHFPILMGSPQGQVYFITNKFHEEHFSQPFSYAQKFHDAFTRVKRLNSDVLEYMDILGNVTPQKTEFGEAIYDFVTEVHRGGINLEAFSTIPQQFLQDENFMNHAINLYAIRHIRFHSKGKRIGLTKKLELRTQAEQLAKDYIAELTNPPIENE